MKSRSLIVVVFATLSFISVFFSGCGSTPTLRPSSQGNPSSEESSTKLSDNQNAVATPLTHEDAIKRSKQIAHVSYGLWFGLENEHMDFEGRATINFELRAKAKDHGSSIFVDFSHGTIRSIVLNGTTLTDITSIERYDGNRIHFKLTELQPGTNRIEIAFLHPYSSNGHGLHRFKDPADQAIYLYSDLEPFFAHNIFPCFDQPDMKAAFELTVETPQDWQVVANTLERDISNVDGRKSWAFPPTSLLSTYVFALIAGDYTSWKSNADGIPMRLFARKSLKKYVDYNEWFDITRKGLEFYALQFGYPYPYSKYDQILVPEFDEGAMENAAAITFSERMVYRTKVTRLAHERRADTILHEMAHMWFGDLVTMKWWNGLWLNESFATFMSSWASSETLPIEGMNKNTAWEDFFSGDKQWAYWQDQLVTTHPIELPVPDTDHAFSNFDGITYGKGASVIKQLRYYLGDDDFREGIQRYFQRFALRNTSLADFMKMLAEASEKDLGSWQEAWLMTSGVNSVKADWACEDGKISKLNLLQTPAENSTVLRPHRTEVGFYSALGKGEGSGKIHLKETSPVTYVSAQTAVPAAVGKVCPDFIYPNSNDYDYVKVELDPKTLEVVSNHLSKIEDTLSRQMFWHSLWEMVVDGKLAPSKYADIVLKQLPTEKDIQIQQKILRSLVNASLDRTSVIEYMTLDLRAQYLSLVETFAMRGLKSSAAGSDSQLIWFHSLLDAAHSPEVLKYLRSVLNGTTQIPNLKIDQEVRWSLVEALARNGAVDAEELINKELAADHTDMGRKSSISAFAQIPDDGRKSEWVKKILAAAPTGTTEGLNGSDLRSAMESFHILGQEHFSEAMTDAYFAHLAQAVKSSDETYVDNYTDAFFPALCSQKVIDLATLALKSEMPISAQKNLKMRKQEEERCLRARGLK